MIFNKVIIFILLFYSNIFHINSLLSSQILTTDSRIKTLVYNANEVYQLKFHYGYQSFIEFQKDEEIELISIGESFAWKLTPAGTRLFIRPLEIAAHTNMTIITNKRTYQFDIKSGEYDGRADEELVYIVRFFFPVIKTKIPISPKLKKSAPQLPPKKSKPEFKVKMPSPKLDVTDDNISNLISGNINRQKLNFDYEISGVSENITPIKIYDDGIETHFQFKNNNLIIPSISEVDFFGNETGLNYSLRNNFVIVPAIRKQFTLRLGDALICVFNNSLK